MAKSDSSHHWKFYRAGGVDQVVLETGADILGLEKLDQKLWVALACPVKGLEFDERTLALLDSDTDGHVRPPEILSAVRWLGQVVKNPDDLAKAKDGVSLSNIRTDTPEGKQILSSSKVILKALGAEAASEISVAEAVKIGEILAKAKHNGDGVVPPAAIADAAARKAAEEIVACLGGTADRSGLPGVDQAAIERFFAECAAFVAWHDKPAADPKSIFPLGDATEAAFAAFDAVRAKIDDWFGRSRLAAYDARALAALNRQEDAYLQVAARDFAIDAHEVAHLPIALVEAGKPLPLGSGINPAWESAAAQFREKCAPLLGKEKTSLTADEWVKLRARFEPYRAWISTKPATSVEKLGADRARELLASGVRKVLEKEIADDLAVAADVNAITQVERLTRFHRDLHKLLLNYVSFSDFYARKKAVFQAGTLYLDGRSCDLCVQVNDAGKHAALAALAKTYLVYVDCTRSGQKMSVACAFTAGDNDNLFVGRNGIFYDRKGQDWNATITKIIENPISIRQAFWSPYKKLLRWIEEQVAKRAAAADEASTTRLQAAAAQTGEAAATGKAPPPAAPPKSKFDVGVVAALGVAVGGITAAFSGLLAAFLGLGAWIPIGIMGLLFAISGPSMLIAWLKLRKRNLGPILDANGWAVNVLTKVNLPLGGVLTDVAKLPPGSSRSLTDPYAPKKSPWPKIIFFLLLLGAAGFGLWKWGKLHEWWPGCPLPKPHREAPAEPAAPPAPDPAPAK